MTKEEFSRARWEDEWGWQGGHARRWWNGPYTRRGNISSLVLRALTEKPMHGYEIIRHLEDKSHGLWRPSPGSIYPTLQMLEEQDLVKSRGVDGKKVYSLTAAGKKEATAAGATLENSPWEAHADQVAVYMKLREPFRDIGKLVKQIVKHGDAAEIDQLIAILSETHKQLTTLVDHHKTVTSE